MEKNYSDLPEKLVSIERVAVVAPDNESKSFLDKLFSQIYEHPLFVMTGVIGSGFIFISVVTYFLISKTSEQIASIENLRMVSAQSQKKTEYAKPVFENMTENNLSVQEDSTSILQASGEAQVVEEVIPPKDTEPPSTLVAIPQNGGTVSSKSDGKICVFMNAPSDNVTPREEIEVFYAFDSEEFTSVKNSVSLCKDVMANGEHILKYKSRDLVGNEEPEKTLSFIVNIQNN